jgi:hypothetical protein
MDVAANPNSEQVLVADNGDQDIERYDYAGNLVGRVGTQGGYLPSPTPGLFGPTRFAGPNGVDVDNSGDIHVSQTLAPGSGQDVWAGKTLSLLVSKLDSSTSEGRRRTAGRAGRGNHNLADHPPRQAHVGD